MRVESQCNHSSPSSWAANRTGRRCPTRSRCCAARRAGRGADGLGPSHARSAGAIRQGGRGARRRGDHRRGRRHRAPAGDGGRPDDPAGARRAGRRAHALHGTDSLLSIVQMPAGVPVGTLAIGKAGAINAALLAVSILANSRPELHEQLRQFRAEQTEAVDARPATRRARHDPPEVSNDDMTTLFARRNPRSLTPSTAALPHRPLAPRTRRRRRRSRRKPRRRPRRIHRVPEHAGAGPDHHRRRRRPAATSAVECLKSRAKELAKRGIFACIDRKSRTLLPPERRD